MKPGARPNRPARRAAGLVRGGGARTLAGMHASAWPNLVTGARLAMMPGVLALALAGERGWFALLLAAALATDVIDGLLARRLNAYSEFGRKLDSVADYVTMFVGLGGIALLWPEITRRELPWIAAGLGAFFAAVIFGFVRLGRVPCYHTWGAKAGAVACALSLVPLLAEWSATPFHAAIVLQVLAAVEGIAITLVLPRHVGEMPSLWHAWRRRAADRA